jgi:thymidylate synthase (FAD)
MKVTYIDHMGSDDRVVDAARVSMDKEASQFSDEKNHKLIAYLAKHGHWTPFAHCQITMRIKAPIFVARQLVKHQIGLTWNEVSRRYVDDQPEFWWPDEWRLRAENVKQGSSEETIPIDLFWQNAHQHNALSHYKMLLDSGVAPELARIVLPLNVYTEWYWTGSLMAFARVCKQRLDPHAQKETQEIAKGIADICAEKFPVSWGVLVRTSKEGE